MSNRDLSTLLAELDAAVEKMTPLGNWQLWDGCSWRRFGREGSDLSHIYPTINQWDGHPDLAGSQYDLEGIVALVNAYPQLREALRSLMHEKATDSWYTGWQVAVRERDEARAERNARARDVMHLEALVEQQREALRIVLNRAEQLFASDRPPPRACGRCGTPSAACDGDCADHVYIAQDLWKARAVLAAEVPRG